MNEKLIEKKLCSWAKKLGGEAFKWWPISVTGLPDRIVLLPGGKIFFAETKSTGEGLRPRQKVVIKFLLKLGFVVGIIDDQKSLDEFTAITQETSWYKVQSYIKMVQWLLDTKYK